LAVLLQNYNKTEAAKPRHRSLKPRFSTQRVKRPAEAEATQKKTGAGFRTAPA
jgi:hypothetical protein